VVYVSDTHPLVFFASGVIRRLSSRALRVFRRAEAGRDRVHISAVTFFEISILLQRGRIRSRVDLDEWAAFVSASAGLRITPLVWDDVRAAHALERLVDPFDRLIAGTAVRLDAPLITGDERIRDSGLVPTVW
jgi:PIN domain nuclease of toxin-antitoxin system